MADRGNLKSEFCGQAETIERLRDGVEIFPAMLAAIAGARRRVELLSYIWRPGEVSEAFAGALAKAAERGVRVRVLLDGFGSAQAPAGQLARLRAVGVAVKLWRRWQRHHGKLLLVEGEVAFVGGVGIADKWAGRARRETQFRIEGPAVGRFAEWFEWWWHGRSEVGRSESGGQVQPVTTGELADVFVDLIRGARVRLRLATPYFCPTRAIVRELVAARERGVGVEVLLPARRHRRGYEWLVHDAYRRELLRAGLRLWRYQAVLNHQKIYLCDEALALIGSPNLNRRSFWRDVETAALVRDADLCAQLHEDFDGDLARSVEVGEGELYGPLGRALLAPLRGVL